MSLAAAISSYMARVIQDKCECNSVWSVTYELHHVDLFFQAEMAFMG